jgi:hypothetical protein
LTRWKNYFSQLLNVQGTGGLGLTENHTAEPFVPEPSAAESEIAIRKLKRYKAPCSDQIPTDQIQAGEGIHKLIVLIWKKNNCVTSGTSQLSCLFTKRVIKLTAVIIEAYHFCELHTKFYLTFFSLG